jgi:hypothetical protein
MAEYTPPSLRKKQQEQIHQEKPLPPPSTESFEKEFPTLGSVLSKNATASQGDSFKQKIHQLIALEQRTENEKRIAEEQERMNRGNTFLSLRLQSTFATQFNNRLEQNDEFETILSQEYECGTLPTTYDMPKTMISELLAERRTQYS